MEISPTVITAVVACFIAVAGFMLVVSTAIGGLIVKAVRLQSKVDTSCEEQTDAVKEHTKLKEQFFQHKEAKEIHFDKKYADLVEDRRNEQMENMRTDITEIKGMVKELAAR